MGAFFIIKPKHFRIGRNSFQKSFKEIEKNKKPG